MAQATFSDLNTAIQGFQDTVKHYAVQSAISDATKQVQGLHSANIDEMQKRQQADELSRSLALKLTGLGADANQIQASFQAIAPKPLKDATSMYAEGLATNSQPLQEQATKVRNFSDEHKMTMLNMKLQQQHADMLRKEGMQLDKQFNQQVTVAQQGYNREVKNTLDKINQIKTVESLPLSQPENRASLLTVAKAVSGDVGNIGEKEASEVLSKTAVGEYMKARNYILGESYSTQTEAQSKELAKILKIAKNTMEKYVDARANKYAYQLASHPTARRFQLDLKGAKEYLAMPEAFGDQYQNISTTNNQPGSANPMDAFLKPAGQ